MHLSTHGRELPVSQFCHGHACDSVVHTKNSADDNCGFIAGQGTHCRTAVLQGAFGHCQACKTKQVSNPTRTSSSKQGVS